MTQVIHFLLVEEPHPYFPEDKLLRVKLATTGAEWETDITSLTPQGALETLAERLTAEFEITRRY